MRGLCPLLAVVAIGLVATAAADTPVSTSAAAADPTPAATPVNLPPAPEDIRGKRFGLAFGELMAVQAIPLGFNNLRDLEFAKINIHSWKDNLENPWKWDNNHFVNNQFSHPYHGALYYNAARANGYDFWASSVFPWAGSLMWEYFGEKWAPAPNDLINTSLGGITLGETFWRLSSLILDNRSRGRERTLREVGAGLLNPVRGFTRLIDGDTSGQTENPKEWRPSRVQAVLDAGYRRIAEVDSLTDRSLDQGFLGLTLSYGDVFEADRQTPFSHFRFRIEAARPGNTGLQTKRLTALQSEGTLHVWNLDDSEHSHYRLASFITYDYLSNPSYEFGGQGVSFGGIAAPLDTGGFRVIAQGFARTYAMAATFSDYFETAEGRNYDYGPGYGASGSLNVLWKGHALVGVNANAAWVETVSGVDGRHYQSFWGADARFFVAGRIGLGGVYRRYHRTSDYDAFPTVRFDSSETRAFLTVALPRFWQ